MFEKASNKPFVIMRNKYGWKLYEYHNIKVWFFGYQYDCSINSLLGNISLLLQNSCIDKRGVLRWIKGLSGHFSIVVESDSWVVAVVDKICTNPIFFVRHEDDIFISNHADALKEECNINKNDLDSFAGLEIFMSGFTIGSKTLYRGIKRLEGGMCLIYHRDTLQKCYYYTYSPWKVRNRDFQQLKSDLTNAFIGTLKSLKNNANGRQIVIPLSAGNDSRLIASGLKELGAKNVICFSYGRKGNFETLTSESIAKRLGYQWLYIPISLKGKRIFFKSDVYHRYVKEFESYGSIPNTQEVYEISLLKSNPLIEKNAIIVNGNSGDFISGGHVKVSSTRQLALDKIDWKDFLDKHYSLWGGLRCLSNDSYIVSELEKALSLRNINIKSIDLEKYNYAVMECIECIGRQSRIVANQQRTYEYFGYDWRLPLWSDEMLAFWEGVPYKDKVDQNLYIKVLQENNFGGVWLDIKVNNKEIRPVFLRWIRTSFKILFIPLGRSRWHKFEKNVLEYFMHPTYALAPVSYFRILFSLKEYRNISSWLSRKMLISTYYFKNNK